LIVVTPARNVLRDDVTVHVNTARFLRKAFGAASEARIAKQTGGEWVVEVRSEGHPVHDPTYVNFISTALLQFFIVGFGIGTTVAVTAKLEAGSAQDGTPAAQLVMLPSIGAP
jgi:hypothetical protein